MLKNHYSYISNSEKHNFGKAILSRLMEDFIYVDMAGEDYRLKR